MRRFLLGNPFLILAIVSYIFVTLWFMAPVEARDPLMARMVFSMVSRFLWPFRTVATWVDPYLRGFPEWIDVLGTALLGAVPYVLADLTFRRTWRVFSTKAWTTPSSSDSSTS
jgi:hypothetical protein